MEHEKSPWGNHRRQLVVQRYNLENDDLHTKAFFQIAASLNRTARSMLLEQGYAAERPSQGVVYALGVLLLDNQRRKSDVYCGFATGYRFNETVALTQLNVREGSEYRGKGLGGVLASALLSGDYVINGDLHFADPNGLLPRIVKDSPFDIVVPEGPAAKVCEARATLGLAFPDQSQMNISYRS